MVRKTPWASLAALLTPVFALGMLMYALTAISNLNQGRDHQDRDQLEQSVRRSAVACYAAEGIYPPDVAYLQAHYGLQVDEGRFTVMYEVFGSNLMPNITVLERSG